MPNFKIVSGRSNPALAKRIAAESATSLGAVSIRNFSDGELWVKYDENIRGEDIFIVSFDWRCFFCIVHDFLFLVIVRVFFHVVRPVWR